MSMPPSVTKSLYHQLMVTIIPGGLVVIPFIIGIYLSPNYVYFKELIKSLDFDHHFAIYAITIMLIFLIGMILENLGSLIEDLILDPLNDVSFDAWKYYLFSECGNSNIKVIHKYVDSIAFRYKFELSLIPALFFFLLICIWICCYGEIDIHIGLTYTIVTITILVLFFTYWQAKLSCKYLNELRLAYMHKNTLVH